MVRTSCVLAACFVFAAVALGSAPAAHANGILVAAAPDAPTPGGTAGTRGPVRLTAHEVHAAIKDRVVQVTVEQVFHSDAQRQLEGTYLFPLPRGAAVGEFAMTMGGKMVAGEVIEADEARRIYDSIVRRRRDPGLLEYVGRGLYRARVFPIEPGSDLTIRLKYQQVLPEDDGVLELRYPLATDRLNGTPVERVLVDVHVESSVDLKGIYSPSHRLAVARSGERRARTTVEIAGRRQTTDFLLYVARSPDEVGFSLLSHKAAGEDGTFMAVLAPRTEVPDGERVPKDIVYVLDTSGSMAGEKLRQAKDALAYGVQLLHADDRFNIVAFANGTHSFREALVAPQADVKAAATTWLEGLTASGGTNVQQALVEALGVRSADRLLLVVFLTDGRPTVGERDPDALVRQVREGNASQARVFTFGVGHDLHVELLDRIAEATRGAREYIAPGEDVEIATGRFFRKVDRPVLSDVAVDLGPGVYDVYPQKLPDLFAGGQVVVYGRYRDAGPRRIVLRGRLAGREVADEHVATFAAGEAADFLPRLWAHRKVAFMLDAVRLNGESKELTDEIVRLAKRFAIVTPYTAGLVVEDRELGRVSSENPLFQIGGRTRRGGGGGGHYRGPSGAIPPGLREPRDPTPPPPSGAPQTPPPATTPAPTPPTSPSSTGKARTAASTDLRRRKEAEAQTDDEDLRAIKDRVQTVAGKTFTLRKDGRWVDTAWEGKPQTVKVTAFSQAWLDLLAKDERIARYLAVGERVVFVHGETVFEVVKAK